MKYILVTDGVISGVGKGVLASSLGAILKGCGLRVTAIKIDNYINIDAATFSPLAHGDVWVLADGGEVDLGLGNYERFMDIELSRDHHITSGKVYERVIDKERIGVYLGKTVQVVPHFTNELQDWVEKVSRIPVPDTRGTCTALQEPEVCIIELSGTTNDMGFLPLLEAFREFKKRVGMENIWIVEVCVVPQSPLEGRARLDGLSPDIVWCHGKTSQKQIIHLSIASFYGIGQELVIMVPEWVSIYHVPSLLQERNVVELLSAHLRLPIPNPRNGLAKWTNLTQAIETMETEVSIAIVGRICPEMKDAYASVKMAVEHAAFRCGRIPIIKYIDATDLEPSERTLLGSRRCLSAWEDLRACDGMILPGDVDAHGIQGKLDAIQWARQKNRPFLGISLGYQLAVMEFARSVLGLKDASSTEFRKHTDNKLVFEMPETGTQGGWRLGTRTTYMCKEDSIVKTLYGGAKRVEERHHHRYDINPDYIAQLEQHGMRFVGKDETDPRWPRMVIMELSNHPYFVGVQFQPEYLSRPHKPSPPYIGLVLAASGQLDGYPEGFEEGAAG